MNKLKSVITAFGLTFSLPACSLAQAGVTEVGLYLFASKIQGEVTTGQVMTDVNASFGDVVSNLDFGLMLYGEHNQNNWIFIADAFYVNLSAEESKSVGAGISIGLDAGIKQLLAEGFVGYRIFSHPGAQFITNLDLLAGLRYNNLDFDLSAQASIFTTTLGTVLSHSESWLDGVGALRGQINFHNGWGFGAWADLGKGSDSDSYQLAAFVNYLFQNNIRLFGGYRLYHFEYENTELARPLNIDLDYKGPMLGLLYRFA